MRLELTRSADAFAERAQAFLAERPERNLLATVLHGVRSGGGFGPAAPLFASATDDRTGHTTAAAIRTPPWPLLATGFGAAAAARELMAAWLALDPEPSAVGAEPATARAIADAYAELTGGATELRFEEAMHTLTAVTPPARRAPGSLRIATADDAALLVRWEHQFISESGMGQHDHAQAAVERRLAAGFQYIWILPDATAVATLAHHQPIAGTVRIGPVFTPRERRNRGYGTCAVAALSQLLLDAGSSRCALFTDLANPTSNKIYASVGYVRFCDWEQRQFAPPPKLRD